MCFDAEFIPRVKFITTITISFVSDFDVFAIIFRSVCDMTEARSKIHGLAWPTFSCGAYFVYLDRFE